MRNPTYVIPETGEVVYVGSTRALEYIKDLLSDVQSMHKDMRQAFVEAAKAEGDADHYRSQRNTARACAVILLVFATTLVVLAVRR